MRIIRCLISHHFVNSCRFILNISIDWFSDIQKTLPKRYENHNNIRPKKKFFFLKVKFMSTKTKVNRIVLISEKTEELLFFVFTINYYVVYFTSLYSVFKDILYPYCFYK